MCCGFRRNLGILKIESESMQTVETKVLQQNSHQPWDIVAPTVSKIECENRLFLTERKNGIIDACTRARKLAFLSCSRAIATIIRTNCRMKGGPRSFQFFSSASSLVKLSARSSCSLRFFGLPRRQPGRALRVGEATGSKNSTLNAGCAPLDHPFFTFSRCLRVQAFSGLCGTHVYNFAIIAKISTKRVR